MVCCAAADVPTDGAGVAGAATGFGADGVAAGGGGAVTVGVATGAVAGGGVGVAAGAGAGSGFGVAGCPRGAGWAGVAGADCVGLIGDGCVTPGAGMPGLLGTGLKLSSSLSGMPSACTGVNPASAIEPAHAATAANAHIFIPPLRTINYLQARSR